MLRWVDWHESESILTSPPVRSFVMTMFVCLSVCDSAFFDGVAIRYVLPILWMTSRSHTMGSMGRIKHDVMCMWSKKHCVRNNCNSFKAVLVDRCIPGCSVWIYQRVSGRERQAINERSPISSHLIWPHFNCTEWPWSDEFQTSSSSSFEFEFELARTFQFLAGSEMSSCLINISFA